MRICVELYYESEWVIRGEGIYITASSLLDLRDRLAHCLDEKKVPTPREITVKLDRNRLPSWMLSHFKLEGEILWKL